MALLHMLLQQPGLSLVVAHANHGMRPDAAEDEALVQAYAERHNLPFYSAQLNLGAGASEATAREARYEFLQQCSKKVNARGIVLAHHQDDLVETALLALTRGTGWRGLAPFAGNSLYIRPLLYMPKHQLIGYARKHAIPWREDSTNTNEAYTRNYIRRTLMPLLDQKSDTWYDTFLQHIRKQQEVRGKLESELAKWLDRHVQYYNDMAAFRRYPFIMAPRTVAYELLQQLFRVRTGHSLERPLAEAALLFVKVAKPQKVMQLNRNWQLKAESANVIVEPRTSVLS